MRRILTLLFMAVALAMTGCKPGDSKQPRVEADSTNVVDESKKDQLLASMRTRLDDLKEELKELGFKIKSGSETVKAEAQPKIKALGEKITALEDQLSHAKDLKWEDFKEGFEKTSEDVKNSIHQARQWLSEKIAPAASTH